MKTLIAAAVAIFGLTGCIAVPAPYAGEAYYHPAPAVGVGIYAPPGFYGHRRGYYGHHRHGHRH
jgi:hypothetical protein